MFNTLFWMLWYASVIHQRFVLNNVLYRQLEDLVSS